MANKIFINNFLISFFQDINKIEEGNKALVEVNKFLSKYSDNTIFATMALSPSQGTGFSFETSRLSLKLGECDVIDDIPNYVIYTNSKTDSIMVYIANEKQEHIIIWKI